jgi:intein/homing endonuclease
MRVVLGNGIPKFISDVKKGDIVISHDGTKQKVLETMAYDVDEKLVEIETGDGRMIRCTQDHKILVNTSNGKKWVPANELKKGDDIVEV